MTMRGEALRRGPQQPGNGRVVGHDESRKQLRHVSDAAPFVAGEQTYAYALFRQYGRA
jgi:hypothetical protein